MDSVVQFNQRFIMHMFECKEKKCTKNLTNERAKNKTLGQNLAQLRQGTNTCQNLGKREQN
jgi:hypothetical protein